MSRYARKITLEAGAALLVTRAGLSIAGFRRWKAAMEWLTHGIAPHIPIGEAEIACARAVARWQAAAARHLPVETNCLDRAVTLWWLLRRRGIAAELRVGGRKENGCFEAHAWVEVAGTALEESFDEHHRFAPFEKRMASMETQVP